MTSAPKRPLRAASEPLPANLHTDALRVTRGDEPVSMSSLAYLVEKLGSALPPTSEVILHDFAQMDSSVVAVGGNVTSRRVGDPPTDVLLAHLAAGAKHDLFGYISYLPDGRQLNSSTLVLRSAEGEPVGALCFNHDVSHWRRVRDIADQALEAQGQGAATGSEQNPKAETAAQQTEHFPRSIDELATLLVEKTIQDVGVPVELMRKAHKLRVVAELDKQGMFLLRDAVELVAAGLGVTRFTIYKYLNELGGDGSKPRT